jgi:hypothetical protein
MSLGYSFRKAVKTIDGLNCYDLDKLKKLCREIQTAEEELQSAGSAAFTRCYSGCAGLCCRNLAIDEIIGFSDFIYILITAGHYRKVIEDSLKNENRIFAADCIFLLNGKGPCIFPQNVRPEVCITTFCMNVSAVCKEIRKIKLLFIKLNSYVFILGAKTFITRLCFKD